MKELTKHILLLLFIIVMASCTKKVYPVLWGDVYKPYSQTLLIKEANLVDPEFRKIVIQFVGEMSMFEKGYNWRAPSVNVNIDYSVLVRGDCRNDSSFVYLEARPITGMLFYPIDIEIPDSIITRELAIVGLVKVDNQDVLIHEDFFRSLCQDDRHRIVNVANRLDEFRLNWYKNADNMPLLYMPPVFIKTYYLHDGKFEYVSLEFPSQLVIIR